MSEPIQQLTDTRAAQILTSVTERLLERPPADLLRSLPPLPEENRGEAARAALLVLAENPTQGPAVRALASGPPPERFLGAVESAALLTAVVAVLQTHGRIELKNGKWSFLLEKKPTEAGVLKPLLEKLCRLVGIPLGP